MLSLKKKFYDLQRINPLFLEGSTQLLKKELRKENKKYKNQHLVDATTIENFLNQQNIYTLYRQPTKTFPRNRYHVTNINELWECDLLDLKSLAKYNSNFKYILVMIDTFSKMLYTRPLLSKAPKDIVNAYESIFKETKTKPLCIRSDDGLEFKSSITSNFLKKNGVRQQFARTSLAAKASIVERGILTLKTYIRKLLSFIAMHTSINNDTAFKKNRYVDYLNKITTAYNNKIHSSTGYKPINVNGSNIIKVYDKLYGNWNKQKYIKPKLKIADYVRTKVRHNLFEKRSHFTYWSDNIYIINKIYFYKIPMYRLQTIHGIIIPYKWYEQELQKIYVPPNTSVKIISKNIFDVKDQDKYTVETADGTTKTIIREKGKELPTKSFTTSDDINRMLFEDYHNVGRKQKKRGGLKKERRKITNIHLKKARRTI